MVPPPPGVPGPAEHGQRGVDPRAAVLSAFAYVVCVASFGRHALVALSPLAVVAALAVAVAPVRGRTLAMRLAWALPLALMVGIAFPFLDTRPMVSLGGVVWSAGWVALLVLVLKVVLCVTVLGTLGAVVEPHRLGAALRGLGMPRVLATQVAFLGRYVELLRAEAGAMRRARSLRSAGSRRASRLRVTAAMIGVLVHRSLDRAERIHGAMLVRGFDGELRSLEPLVWRARDTLLVVVVVAACASLRAWPWTGWLGWGSTP